MFQMTSGALEKMIEYSEADFPNEACGYLAGNKNIATEVVPMKNVHESPTSYEMDPKEQLLFQKTAREKGWELMGIYHSHVATEAFPSRRDIDQATAIQDFFDGHYILVTLKKPGLPVARAFKIRDSHVQEEKLEEV